MTILKTKAFQYCIVIMLLVPNLLVFGQTFQGQIVNSDHEPLIGAHIYHFISERHVHTDVQGQFILKDVNLLDSIEITYLGFESQIIRIPSLERLHIITLQAKTIGLDEIVVSPDINALSQISGLDLQLSPVNSAQDVLTQVPGIFIGQHAGGGKAEQIFLRGFDIDHGTDIAISVDEMPVNMVSHAHGQGYADLHFLIPETIERIDFGKGPYYANQGNFSTAGHINFETKQKLSSDLLKIELGQFNTKRLLGMFNVLDQARRHAYLASEFLLSDGPFESPQDLKRFNVFGKLMNQHKDQDEIGLTFSHFQSTWNASGQIPQRSVDQGDISRFGAIDDTEGGTTSRTNIIVEHNKIFSQSSSLKSNLFYSKYAFELYSNFTFFLEDPLNGDQIRQKEERDLLGFNSEFYHKHSLANMTLDWHIGLSFRSDLSKNNELSHTKNRSQIIDRVQLGNITESNLGTYVNTNISLNNWTLHVGLRYDQFDFGYQDDLNTSYDPQTQVKSIWSPKMNILYNYNRQLQLYLKTGKGFHSNDSRVVIQKAGSQILPAVYGADLGLIWKPRSNFYWNAALWYLYSEQEFVYVGDAGIVEPSGESRRYGLDLSMRFQPWKWIFLNLDGNYTYARQFNLENVEEYIPLAPDLTVKVAIHFRHDSGFYGGLKARFMNNRPANEDYTIIAKGYTIMDLNFGYVFNRFDFGIQVQNVLNEAWNETQFATESRLLNETNPIKEIHFTPGTPFFLKGVLAIQF